MPHSYSPQYREMVLVQVRAGRPVAELADELEVSEATIFRWKKQDQIDRGLRSGTSTDESSELRAARQRIAELEVELAATKRASDLWAKDRVVRPKDIYPIVATLGAEGHGLKAACRLLGVAPSGFFRARSKPLSARAVRRAWLADVITEIWERSRRTYGWRRVQAELDDAYGHRANTKLVRSIMRELGVAGLPRKRRVKVVPANRSPHPDLVRRAFDRDGPNQLWMTDITEHPTREGRVYCCVVMDAWSRKIVGWSIDRRPTTAMVNSALAMAVDARRPEHGTLVHSDHGSQYTSWSFSRRVRSERLVHSLGSIGDAFDNAVVESFWGRMQTELLNTKKWKTHVELSTAMFDWIEGFYNRSRRHTALGMISPVEFERRHAPTAA